MYPFYQGRTIRRLIIFISQHPVGLLRMTWEGLYVALSRVKYRDHIRLAIKRNDRSTMQYISNLEKDKYIHDCSSWGTGRRVIMEWKGVGIEQEQERLQCSKQEQGRRERRLLPQTSGGESVRSISEVSYVGDVL